MNVLGIILGAIISIGIIAINLSMAIKAIEFLLSFIFSPLGIIIVQILMFVVAVYFISNKIKEYGFSEAIKSIFISSDNLCISFWVYFFSFRTTIDNLIYYAVKVDRSLATTGAILNIFLIYSIGISTIVTAMRSKSFILWRGLSITVICLLLCVTAFGVYIADKENITIAEMWYSSNKDSSNTTYPTINKNKIDDWKNMIDNLLG